VRCSMRFSPRRQRAASRPRHRLLCGAAAQYTASGSKTGRVAQDGTVTFTAYDTKGRQTKRATFAASCQSAATRPALTNANKVVSTQWHATLNLLAQVAEPKKIAARTCDAAARRSSDGP
jgi:CDP-diacylglycerol pyrophosphatase